MISDDREGEEEAGAQEQGNNVWRREVNRTEWGLAGQAKEDYVL